MIEIDWINDENKTFMLNEKFIGRFSKSAVPRSNIYDDDFVSITDGGWERELKIDLNWDYLMRNESFTRRLHDTSRTQS